ncbi:lipid kinase YegS [Thalassotalea sp. LPB0316]|uniref:lipid kinase YegS n=1 Tax=Thalassotalea sp. LPB0316 TaxID=2769490 RepID=UPI001868DC7A|nr:lipid kinase YegS [Thalassotalea sp. LPB0316]QOL25380.1 lipid kinase YegS [Thalassotalea sp. LPB0316]
MSKIRVILNGKKAILDEVREAIFAARAHGDIEVRVTFEGGDATRFVNEAINDNCERIVAGGGDGTVNELTNALMKHPADKKPELAIMPLGTANDFASACKIPSNLLKALKLALTGNSYPVDSIQAGDDFFLNVASCGFGAQVTTNTPVALKNFLGGGAYTISGLVQALKFEPFKGTFSLPDQDASRNIIVAAICNGRQAGGGQVLAPAAVIDDGLMDIVSFSHFAPEDVPQVLSEIQNPTGSGKFIERVQVSTASWKSEVAIPINLDGEPISTNDIEFKVHEKAINLVLPDDCPLLSKNN